MRQIGTLADERQVQRLGDYLLTKGIRVQVEQSDGGFAVWAIDEDHVAKARDELSRFIQNPDDERYLAAEREARTLRDELIRKEKDRRRSIVDVRRQWTRPRARPLTFLLIVICCAVAFATRFNVDDDDPLTQKLVIAEYRISGNLVKWWGLGDSWTDDPVQAPPRFQFWRLITPIFLHIGPVHLLMNMMAMQNLGTLIELRRGPWRMAMMVLVIAVVSNLVQYAYDGPRFAGISGVAFGLFGYAWIKSEFDPAAGIAIHPSSVKMMLVFMVICQYCSARDLRNMEYRIAGHTLWRSVKSWQIDGYFAQLQDSSRTLLVICMTGLIGPIGNAAHVAGLVTGILLGYGPVVKRLFLSR